MKAKKIDLNSWNRKNQYDFFRSFDQPFFNVTVPSNIDSLLSFVKQNKQPFFLTVLHCILKAVHQIPEFRYRIEGPEVYDYSSIDAGITILLEDNSFMYCTVQYEENFDVFIENAIADIETQKKARGFVPHQKNNIIYVSSLPWLSFTGFQHARKTNEQDSIPRFLLGKYYKNQDNTLLPLSTEVHHALADGFHLGQFYQFFEAAQAALIS